MTEPFLSYMDLENLYDDLKQVEAEMKTLGMPASMVSRIPEARLAVSALMDERHKS